MLSPASRQMSMRWVACSTLVEPQALKNSEFSVPKVPVPRVRTGTLKPELPRRRDSMFDPFGGSFEFQVSSFEEFLP